MVSEDHPVPQLVLCIRAQQQMCTAAVGAQDFFEAVIEEEDCPMPQSQDGKQLQA